MRSNTPLPIRIVALTALAASGAASSPALAQPAPAPAGNAGAEEGVAPAPASGQGVTVVPGPAAPAAPGYPGYLPPPGWDPDAHLPSSSHSTTDTSRSTDGFDMIPKGSGPASVHGGPNGQFLGGGEGSYVPRATP